MSPVGKETPQISPDNYLLELYSKILVERRGKINLVTNPELLALQAEQIGIPSCCGIVTLPVLGGSPSPDYGYLKDCGPKTSSAIGNKAFAQYILETYRAKLTTDRYSNRLVVGLRSFGAISLADLDIGKTLKPWMGSSQNVYWHDKVAMAAMLSMLLPEDSLPLYQKNGLLLTRTRSSITGCLSRCNELLVLPHRVASQHWPILVGRRTAADLYVVTQYHHANQCLGPEKIIEGWTPLVVTNEIPVDTK